MRQHRWVGLGTSEFAEERASEWSTLDGPADAPLALNIAQVVCLICDVAYLDASDECPGPMIQPERHRWLSMMTLR
jgi:hypothetical protein